MLRNLSRMNSDDQRAVVEVTDGEASTGQCCEKVDLDITDEVVLLAPEPVVGLLLNDNDNVSCLRGGRLVALAAELDRLAALHSPVDVHLEELLVGHDFLALALVATILHVYCLAGS